MNPAPKELKLGVELPTRCLKLTREKLQHFASYVNGGQVDNHHTDDTLAQKLGFPRAFAHGRHLIACLSEYLLDTFGAGWVQGGKLDLTILQSVYVGESVTLHAKVKKIAFDGSKQEVQLDVWITNQQGFQVISGVASAYYLPGAGIKPADNTETT